jgi:F-type H+-transporting ATPase subunit delta
MAELVTVARPYAEAAFKAALEQNQLRETAESLALAAAIGGDEAMRSALTDPRVGAEQKRQLFFAVGGDGLGPLTRNVVSLLIDNHREALLPAIAELFEAFAREHERVVHASITSARPLDDAQRAEILSALEKQYGRKVEAELHVDPELLGGARVQVGDQVIHASVRDALAHMAAALAR